MWRSETGLFFIAGVLSPISLIVPIPNTFEIKNQFTINVRLCALYGRKFFNWFAEHFNRCQWFHVKDALRISLIVLICSTAFRLKYSFVAFLLLADHDSSPVSGELFIHDVCTLKVSRNHNEIILGKHNFPLVYLMDGRKFQLLTSFPDFSISG